MAWAYLSGSCAASRFSLMMLSFYSVCVSYSPERFLLHIAGESASHVDAALVRYGEQHPTGVSASPSVKVESLAGLGTLLAVGACDNARATSPTSSARMAMLVSGRSTELPRCLSTGRQ